MCTKQYLVLRKRALLRLIEQTVVLSVEGAEDGNGGCLPGKLEEMKVAIETLHSLANHLGLILCRIDRLPDEIGEIRATALISSLIFKLVGDMPPEDLFKTFDPTMN